MKTKKPEPIIWPATGTCFDCGRERPMTKLAIVGATWTRRIRTPLACADTICGAHPATKAELELRKARAGGATAKAGKKARKAAPKAASKAA